MPPPQRRGSGSTQWSLAYHAQPLAISIAEPSHRIGPKGVCSGISLRENDFPKSSVQKVKDICIHFVRKCSGKYLDNKAAARYVHHMADEVIGQLAGVAAQIKKHEAEPEIYQGLLDEWRASFPESLGAHGSPRNIAVKLDQQREEISILRNALEVERVKNESEVADVLRSMNTQLSAYKSGILSERRQIQVAQELELQEKDREIEEVKARLTDVLDDTKRDHQDSLKRLITQHTAAKRELQNTIDKLGRSMENLKNQYELQISTMRSSNENKIGSLYEKIDRLEERLLSANGVGTGDDGDSVVSLGFGDDSDSESESDSSSESDTESVSGDDDEGDNGSRQQFTQSAAAGGVVFSQRPDRVKKVKKEKKPKKEKKEKKEKRPKQKRSFMQPLQSSNHGHSQLEMTRTERNAAKLSNIKLTGIVGEAVKAMKEEIKALKSEKKKTEEAINIFLANETIFKDENSVLRRRVDELEKFTEEMRAALRLQQNAAGFHPPARPGRLVNATPHPSCHTPHFLDKPDSTGPRRSIPGSISKMTGYQVAGHF